MDKDDLDNLDKYFSDIPPLEAKTWLPPTEEFSSWLEELTSKVERTAYPIGGIVSAGTDSAATTPDAIAKDPDSTHVVSAASSADDVDIAADDAAVAAAADADTAVEWYTPASLQEKRSISNPFCSVPDEVAANVEKALESSSDSIKASLGIPRRYVVESLLYSDGTAKSDVHYTYAGPNCRAVPRKYFRTFARTKLASIPGFSLDMGFNNLIMEKRVLTPGLLGLHTDAPVFETHKKREINNLDMVRFMWSAVSGEYYGESVESGDDAKKFSTLSVKAEPMQDLGVFKEVFYKTTEYTWENDAEPVSEPIKQSSTVSSSKKDSFIRPNGEVYIARKIVTGGKTIYDVDMIRTAREERINVLLRGEPGTGKTALVEAALENLQVLECDASTEASDFIGSYVPTGAETFEWRNGPLLEAAINGWPFLADEIAMCDPRVLPVLYSSMDGRDVIHVSANPDIGEVKIKDGFYVIGACNPNVPGAIMSDALLSRFPLQLEVTTDYKLLVKMGVSSDIIVVATNLAKQAKNGSVLKAPQTRDLLAFKKIESTFGREAALSNFVGSADPSDMDTYASVVSSSYGIKVNSIKI